MVSNVSARSIMMSAVFMLCHVFCLAVPAKTQIGIETQTFALVFQTEQGQRLNQIYCGQKLLRPAEYNNSRAVHHAYIGAGLDDLFEPAVRMVHNDGNPSLELLYSEHQTTKNGSVNSTVITLKDPVYPVTVKLFFEAYYDLDLIKTWTEISHKEKQPVTVDRFASGMLHIDAQRYWLTQFNGEHMQEMRMKDTELTQGIMNIDSKLGARATKYQAPFFFLSLDKPSTETEGEVFGGTLAWSGNFQLAFEIDQANSLRVICGMNPYASQYALKPDEKFITPPFIYTFSAQGRGQASRNFHDWARQYGVVDGQKPRLTLLNNWEATHFDFDQDKLVSLFDGAAKLGVDMFLLDDGWFANKYPRSNDKAGLGDWQVNTKILPDGVGYLVEQAEAKGIKFGIWIEPEMVNPKSELYEQHPDWVLKLPNRAEHYQRNQLVLDLTNPEVQQFVYSIVDDLMTENPSLAYFKWDCNRTMTNEYSVYLKDKQSHLYIEYVRGLYKVFDRIRQKYPHLPMMLCSGGGGRTDYGSMKYFTEIWASDNTDAFDRVFIQWGFSNFFPANTVCNHVTSMGAQSLKFRTDVAMMGKLGYDIQVNDLTEQEVAFSRRAIENYNRLSPVIWYGDLYRLRSPFENDQAALMYTNKEKTAVVLFAYTLYPLKQNNTYNLRLNGLDPQKKYKVQEINLFADEKSIMPENGKVLSGDYLMKAGLTLQTKLRLTSQVIELTESAK